MLETLNAVPWSQLGHVYGEASDVSHSWACLPREGGLRGSDRPPVV
ncbi:MAG TPA: hypothetical protein VKR06_04995 [Ktedonosporobacter sp.]|nr:hypothetical protein [Ktedonosporobacter sp.]